VWRAAFFVALFGFAGFVALDLVFDALNVDDLEVFGFPDDDVTFVGKTTVEDYVGPFFGRDLPPADSSGLVPVSLLAFLQTEPLDNPLRRDPVCVRRNSLLPRVNLLHEKADSSSPADPA
jgi:hypothetical protein